MAAQTLLFPATAPPAALFQSPSSARPFHSLRLAAASRALLVAADATKKAVAVLKGTSEVEGIVTLTQQDEGPTTLSVRVTGLTPGLPPRAHFNPNNMMHGAPEDELRHAGDLGNVVANAEGVVESTVVDNQIPLSGPNSVVGRAFVVHELEDDLGKGGHELSLTTGNAGGRLACGVVGLTPL